MLKLSTNNSKHGERKLEAAASEKCLMKIVCRPKLT